MSASSSEPRLQSAAAFLDRHRRDGCFLMPNAWDAGSARLLVAAGFDVLGTTSAGIAFSLGRPDHGDAAPAARVDRGTMIARVREIAEAVPVAVNADLEGGFGPTPEDVVATVEAAIDAGAAGGNIEDYTGDPAAPLVELPLAVERVRAARAAIDARGVPFVLVARTDRLNLGRAGGLDEAVRRANLYREAGADCLFAPGVSDPETVGRLVREIDGPLNVVMGLSGHAASLAQLRDLGVRRVSIGGSLARAALALIRDAAREMAEEGTFRFAERQVPQAELNRLFGRF